MGKDKLTILTIQRDSARKSGQYDIAIPQLTPDPCQRKSLDHCRNRCTGRPSLPLPAVPTASPGRRHTSAPFHYDGLDFVTMEREFEPRVHPIPTPQTANEVIGYYARLIASDLKLPPASSAVTGTEGSKSSSPFKAFGGASRPGRSDLHSGDEPRTGGAML